jgi:hypothetical protein
MVIKSSGSCQLSFADIFEVTAVDDKSSANDVLQNNNLEHDRGLKKVEFKNDGKPKFSKNKVSFPKEIEVIIEQFFAGKI